MQTSLPSLAAHVPASIRPSPPTRGAEVVTRDGRSLPLVSARLRAEAQGGIARLVLEQRFENRHAETLHVTYRMPLPADGAVSGYAFDIAGRTITGRIDRRRAARDQFERAVASGKTAALLEQDRADIFTQSIGNLPAGEALIARIAIDQKLVWLPDGEWELRFPTVIGPRYLAATDTAADTRATAVETTAGGVGARIQIAIRIGDAILPGRGPASPSHSLVAGADGLVELRDVAGARLDRDLVIRWPVAGAAVGLALQVARPVHQPVGPDDAFGLLTIVPPAREARARPVVRDLIVLVDTSGSMSGGPLDKAKQVVAMLIDSLGDDDRLELIEFSSRPRRYKPDAMPATRSERQAAIRWLRGLSAGGGTEMRAAVIEAMRALRPGSQRQVVLATDGYIGGEDHIVHQLHTDLPRSCRLHVLGVGSSVNRTLASSLARAGRGAEVVCDLDEDAERAARRLIDRTRMPILTNVSVAGSAVIEHAPELMPDVFEGAPLVAAIRLRPGELVVRGELAHGAWEHRLAVRPCPAGAGNQAIVALFGREHIADLETRAFAGDRNDAEIERTGLAFQIATRFTSWIAIDEVRAVAGPTRHEVMPQALPYGTTAAAFGLREATAMLGGDDASEYSEQSRVMDIGESPMHLAESPMHMLAGDDDDAPASAARDPADDLVAGSSEAWDDSSAVIPATQLRPPMKAEHAEQRPAAPEAYPGGYRTMFGVGAPETRPAKLPVARVQAPGKPAGSASRQAPDRAVERWGAPVRLAAWLVILALVIAALWWFVR